MEFKVLNANSSHVGFAQQICDEMALSAQKRGTGIAKRTPAQIVKKIMEGKAVIALTEENTWAGFCYIEAWEQDAFVSNSGLIVAPEYREHGLAREIKRQILTLSTSKYTGAKVFGLTTSAAVMKINSELGYRPVIYADITQDDNFWEGCKSCVNYGVLISKSRKNCLCTAMILESITNSLSNSNN